MASKRNDASYIRKRDALKRHARANDAPCHLCSRPIDYEAKYPAPLSFTADHVEAVAAGGHMLGELRPAHARCNSRRGKKDLATYLDTRPETITGSTLSW